MAEENSPSVIEKNQKENEEEMLQIMSEEFNDPTNSQEDKKIICDFIITKKIGEGTFSNVKLAKNRQTGEQVAIKIIEKNKFKHKEDKLRFNREK